MRLVFPQLKITINLFTPNKYNTMKKLSIIVSILLISSIQPQVSKSAPPVKKAVHKTHKADGSPIVFWTSNCSYGPIQIYVNDVYQGDITSCYNNVPECAANGCVTVIVYGTNNVWTAQTKDGRRKWASKRVTLAALDCNSERLL